MFFKLAITYICPGCAFNVVHWVINNIKRLRTPSHFNTDFHVYFMKAIKEYHIQIKTFICKYCKISNTVHSALINPQY